MTYRLIYTSTAAPFVTDADFRSIAMFSSISNRRRNISGLLLHSERRIMQVLEGSEIDVKTLFTKIERDKRHCDVNVEMSIECEKPYFQNWSMGFRPVESSEQMDVFFELTKDSPDSAVINKAEKEMREIIGNFAAVTEI